MKNAEDESRTEYRSHLDIFKNIIMFVEMCVCV